MTPKERDPSGAKRLAGHGSYRAPINLEMSGEPEDARRPIRPGGFDSTTGGGGVIGKEQEWTSGKPSSEYGQSGPPVPRGTIGWPFSFPSGPMKNTRGFGNAQD